MENTEEIENFQDLSAAIINGRNVTVSSEKLMTLLNWPNDHCFNFLINVMLRNHLDSLFFACKLFTMRVQREKTLSSEILSYVHSVIEY